MNNVNNDTVFQAERRRKQKGSTSPLQDEPEEEELDEETQALDSVAMERIKQIILEYQEEMNNFELKKEGKFYWYFCLIACQNLVVFVNCRGGYGKVQ